MKWLRTLAPIVLVQLLLLTTVLVIGVWGIWSQQQQQTTQQRQQELLRTVNLISLATPDLPTASPSTGWRKFVSLANKKTGFRFTVINSAGIILSDPPEQHNESNAVENRLNRSEIRQATESGSGSATRKSDATGEDLILAAVKHTMNNGETVFIHAAGPLVAPSISAMSTLYLIALAAIGGLNVGSFAFFVYRIFANPIARLKQAANWSPLQEEPPQVYFGQQHLLADVGQAFNERTTKASLRFFELKDAHARLTAVLASLVDGVLAVDHRERIVIANRTAREFLQLPRDDLSERKLFEVARIHALQELLETTRAHGSGDAEFEFGDPPRQFEAYASRVADDEKHDVVFVIRDISELRRLERMRQTFIANVSHELKTPLTAIKGYAETLASGALHDENINMRFLGRIEEQADLLNRLVLDMIALSRVQSGEQSFEITDVSVGDVVERCVFDQQEAATAKGVSLQIETGPAAFVRADEEAVRQILQNLVDNAVKYTPGGGNVTVGWQALSSTVEISVADTGPGISPKHQERLFERFYRVDKARSRELGGTGLGLSIVKNLAISFGGSVSLESEIGKGSRFAVILPKNDLAFIKS